MKIRKVFMAVCLVCSMMLTACSGENGLLGSWKGEYQVSDIVKEIYGPTLLESDKGMEEYLAFEGLSLELTFVFSEKEMSIQVSDESKEQLKTKITESLVSIYSAYIEGKASKKDMTVDGLYAANNTTKEAATESFLKGMKVDEVVSVITGAFQVAGNYEIGEDVIYVVYPDETWEKLQYSLEGKNLTITISNGQQGVAVVCEKAE